ncbi:MAG: hypothetical protein NDJ94_03280 [Vicinamibacteria bacterium]|nr:hypothetical protein [Vicinamibacteria bacterium]
MRKSLRSAVVGALALAAVVGPSRALAAEPAPEPVAVTATATPTLAHAAGVKAAAALPAAALAPAQAQASGTEKGFFKSGKGVAVLTLLVAAAGYTVYSADNDRVKSPIRN